MTRLIIFQIPSLYPYLPGTKYDWNLTSSIESDAGYGLKTREIYHTCARVLGGGSSINYMYYMRGCPGDYDSWAKLSKDPTCDFSNILPYFIKSERLLSEKILKSRYRLYHGTKGFLGVTRENRPEIDKYLEAFGELGNDILLDINGERTLGYTPQLYTIAEGWRQTTAFVNLGKNKHRENLYVLKRTVVRRILFDEYNNAIGVEAMTENQKIITIKAKREVIVSAGAINTPKLLMLSGIGPREHLESLKINIRSELPVGRNFQDHWLLLLSFIMEKTENTTEPGDPHQLPYPIITGHVTLNKSKSCADYQTYNSIVPRDSPGPLVGCAFNFRYKNYLCQNMYDAGKGRNTMMSVFSLLHPKSRGKVTLQTNNPMDPPNISNGLFSDERDVEDMTTYLEHFVRVVNTTYFRKVKSEIVDIKIRECAGRKFGSKDYWKCFVRSMTTSSLHFIGTASLGSVVDSKLRVFKVNRLRVADASIMPSHVSGNPNAVVLMIAEKLADFVKEEHCHN
ncbi:unnamed protein product [Euphydryas editha]|uniref:Glucose-methanol-choline oxidoreductase N-terminal domain-containing protein n=1 Tax=Euphydryas editha TaxID=104508 RepID=A0AAU9V8R7_EUPED|nr:unnamed protein product [Euphydryas editha]